MSQAQRFTFDREFDRDRPGSGKTAQPKRALSVEEIEAIKADAFREGAKAAEAEAAKRTVEELVALTGKLGALLSALDEVTRPARAEAIKLAYLMARKLARALVEAQPEAEVMALIGQCIEEQRSEPNIVIRVNDGLLEAVKAEAVRLSQEHSFMGRVLVIGEPQIAAGNCSVEWANGGLERDFGALVTAMDEIVQTYLHAGEMDDPKFLDRLKSLELKSLEDGPSTTAPEVGGK